MAAVLGRADGRALVAVVGVLGLLALVSTSCAPASANHGDGVLRVTASFYPLQYIVERVGGPHVKVANLTPAGAEPHDIELSARDLVNLRRADLVVYLSELAPAVDDGVRVAAKTRALDVTSAARVNRGIGKGGTDRHFWLDPMRLADAADAVAQRLSSLDGAHRAEYEANASALRADLVVLDHDLATGLARCANNEIVTSHEAFGYLADRYGFHEVGISGLQPDAEPTAATLASISDLVKAHGVSTIYTETLVSESVARTIARATGTTTAVLDPLEGLPRGATRDYLDVMRSNLVTLRHGQGCT